MEIFWRLLFGHLLADFTCQTNYVAAWKRRSRWGLLFHVTTHPILYIALTWNHLDKVWVQAPRMTGWACLALIFATHFIEDEWRIWSVTKHGAPDNMLFYLWDQVIHIVILYAVSPVTGGFIENKWPLLGCLFVVATHFATVTIYFVEKDLFGKSFPDTLPKYGGMFVRVLVFGSLLLPGYWWLLVLAAVELQIILARRVPALAFSRTALVLGNVIAVGCGVLGRYIYFHV